MKKLITTIVFGVLISFVLCAQDTVAIAHHDTGELSAIIINTGDQVHITAFNQEGNQIYNKVCDLEKDIVDYMLTYFDSGAVETIKIVTENYDSDSKIIEFYEFDYLGHEVRAKHISGVDVEIENESKSYNFEGGVIFRPAPDEAEE